MNIWLPIITNIVIVMILVAGLFIGRKNGFKIEFTKFILTIGAIIGSYFLTPIITKFILKMGFVNNIATTISSSVIFNSIILLLTFILFYLLICLIGFIINQISMKKANTVNIAKSTSSKNLDKKTRKLLKKDEKRLKKLNRKKNYKVNKVSQIFGAIFGVLIAFVMGFVISLPIKYMTQTIAETNSELTQIDENYGYTLYGAIDNNIFDISDFIIGDKK